MNKQDYITKIKASSLDESKKTAILQLLENNEFDFDTKERIKDIIQDDIDASFEEAGINVSDDSEAKAASDALTTGLDAAEKEVEEDMNFVEKEMNDLDDMVKGLDKADDSAKIDQIKSDLTQ